MLKASYVLPVVSLTIDFFQCCLVGLQIKPAVALAAESIGEQPFLSMAGVQKDTGVACLEAAAQHSPWVVPRKGLHPGTLMYQFDDPQLWVPQRLLL